MARKTLIASRNPAHHAGPQNDRRKWMAAISFATMRGRADLHPVLTAMSQSSFALARNARVR